MSQNDSTDRRNAGEIESDIADSRVRIDHTLDLLEDRFRPSAVFDQAWEYARAKREDGTTSWLQDTVVRNPLPIVLMGVGLAWLLLSGRDGSVPDAESPLTTAAENDQHTTDSKAREQVNPSPAKPAETQRTVSPIDPTPHDKAGSAARESDRANRPRSEKSAPTHVTTTATGEPAKNKTGTAHSGASPTATDSPRTRVTGAKNDQ